MRSDAIHSPTAGWFTWGVTAPVADGFSKELHLNTLRLFHSKTQTLLKSMDS